MQRSNQVEVNRWSQARAGSIVMIGLSLIAIMIIIKLCINTVSLYIKTQNLEKVKNNLQQQIEDLEERNDYINDSNYYIIYTSDEYQLSGGNIILIPKE